MRYKSRYHRVDIPREQRLCRFGCHQVENVEHAMLHCTEKPELKERCHQFMVKVAAKEPRIHAVTPGNATAVLRALIFRRVPGRKICPSSFPVVRQDADGLAGCARLIGTVIVSSYC
jgi:hypothetical protein